MATIREINPESKEEIELVASRMRQTLIEVLGEERGGNMYTMDWLVQRVEWHLNPESCTGHVFVAQENKAIVGHTIVRLDKNAEEEPIGLFSTIYVIPEARASGIAKQLISQGEEWLAVHGMRTFTTYTDEGNTPLIKLFGAMGYAVAEIRNEFAILTRSLP
jgi:GNAT superfamily N-acetyltransferase